MQRTDYTKEEVFTGLKEVSVSEASHDFNIFGKDTIILNQERLGGGKIGDCDG